MSDLVAFLRARLDEDEQIAREASGLAWSRPEYPGDPAAIRDSERERVVCDEGWPSEEQAVHIAAWDPARVLREVEAERQILAAYEQARQELKEAAFGDAHPADGGLHVGKLAALSNVLRLLALPYADHSDFDEAWRAE